MGRLTDNLKFNVGSNIQYAQQQGIAGPANAPSQGLARATKAIQQFVGIMPKIAEQQVKEGRKTAEKGMQAGYQGVDIDASGTEFADSFRKQNEKLAQDLRDRGEITLVDDPYFQEGYQIAKGEMETLRFQNETKAWYDNVKNNPNLYKDRRAFEEALQLRFDLAFSQLPRNQYIQAGFMKNMAPFVENVKSQYKVDLNNHHRKEYLISQKGKTSGSVINYKEELKLIQNFSDEEVVSFLQSMPEQLWYDDLPMDMEEMTPEYAREKLRSFAYEDMIDDLNEVGRDLHQFQGEGEYGLGVNPTEARLEFLVESIDDPYLAETIIQDLDSGTGKLADTARGKATLAKLYENAKEKAESDYIERLSEPINLLDADIATLQQIAVEEETSVDEVFETLTQRVNDLWSDYPEERAKRLGKLRENLNRAKSPYSRLSTGYQRERVGEIVGSVGQSIGDPSYDALTGARALVGANELMGTETRSGVQNLVQNSRSNFYANPQDDRARTEFWNTAGTVQAFDEMGGPTIRMDPNFGSEQYIRTNPQALSILGEAHSRGVMGAFVASTNEFREVIEDLYPQGDVPYTDPNFGPTIVAELDNRKREEVQERQQKEREEDLGFDPLAIPIRTSSASKLERVSSRELANMVIKDDKFYTPQLGEYLTNEYSKLYGEYAKEYSKDEAALRAYRDFTKKFKKETVEYTQVQNSWYQNDEEREIAIIEDKQNPQGIIVGLQAISADPEVVIKSFVDNMEENSMLNHGPLSDLKFADFVAQTAENVVESRNTPEAFQRHREDALSRTRPIEQADVDKIAAKLSELEPVYGEAVIEFFEGIGQGVLGTQGDAGDLATLSEYIVRKAQAEGLEVDNVDGILEVISRNSSEDISFSVFGAKFQADFEYNITRRVTEDRATMSPEEFLRTYLSPEVFEAVGSQVNFQQMTKKFKLSNKDFDWSGEDYSIIPYTDGTFVFSDSDGTLLSYEETGAPFVFTSQDIVDHGRSRQRMNAQTVWGLIKDRVPFKGTYPDGITRDELKEELKGYFEKFPSTLPLWFFRDTFGDAGYQVYSIYKEIE